MSIELPATSRHRRDMTEKFVESDFKPKSNKQTNQFIKPFLDKKKMSLFLRNMEPLIFFLISPQKLMLRVLTEALLISTHNVSFSWRNEKNFHMRSFSPFR